MLTPVKSQIRPAFCQVEQIPYLLQASCDPTGEKSAWMQVKTFPGSRADPKVMPVSQCAQKTLPIAVQNLRFLRSTAGKPLVLMGSGGPRTSIRV